ncbi:GNAT family N-acetyltransferase [Paenibacillus oralis]|nr:GNAT family N-acetyltransferase [Paenibacillus oralis]
MSIQVLSPALVIRKGCCDDCQHMLPLMRQLRYPTTPSVLKERLSMLEEHPLFSSLVAELDGVIVGTAFLKQYQTHDMSRPVTQITALIVDEKHRGSGFGKRLIEEAENWGRQRSSSELIVSTARENYMSAKSFYEHLGFTSLGYRLSKSLL